MPLYFAYGSNMDADQLAERFGNSGPPAIEPLAIARLGGYALEFTRYSPKRGGGVADIVARDGSEVWGMVFALTDPQMAALDGAEGVAMNPAPYRRKQVTVELHTKDGQPVRGADGIEFAEGASAVVETYEVVAKATEHVGPGEAYWQRIAKGAEKLAGFARNADVRREVQGYVARLQEIRPARKPAILTVADIRLGAVDAAGATVAQLYTRDAPHYAVYRTIDGVAVQFADDATEAAAQRKAMQRVNGLRTKINALIDGWRRAAKPRYQAKARRYDGHIAEALRLCLEGDADAAFAAMTQALDDIHEERSSWGRFEYLISASGFSLALILLCFVADQLSPAASAPDLLSHLWCAAAAGAIGAFFSIAIGIRNRTVLTTLRRRDNYADAALRVVIGVIAAGVLICLFDGDVIPSFHVGSATLSGGAITWQAVLDVGFVAGFLERLVPDLLEKSSQAPATGNPA